MHKSNRGTKNGALAEHVIKLISNTTVLLTVASTCFLSAPASAENLNGVQQDQLQVQKKQLNSGSLWALSPTGERLGEFPLRHTSVDAKISGYAASVTVKQEFQNPYSKTIEAVYCFPLSDSGAVDKMTMNVNGHVIEGRIKTKEEARAIYERAKSSGDAASILEQERTNVFKQSVANIKPGESVVITLHYQEILSFESGKFTFTFPMDSGTIPSKASDEHAKEPADSSAIRSKNARHQKAASPEVSINVDIDAGVPVKEVLSKFHAIQTHAKGSNETIVSYLNTSEVPNQDFILSWSVSDDQIRSGYLTHKDPQSKDGYFTLMLMPPKKPSQEQIYAKDMIFLIDCSGSQDGPPLTKAKETLKYLIDHMNSEDTFQIIAFGTDEEELFDKSEHVSPATKEKAWKFINRLEGHMEGSWRTAAVQRVLSLPNDAQRLRIVTFMTDGYMGYDKDIINLIHQHRNNARWFPFGVSTWMNTDFVRSIAREGGGEPEFTLLDSSANDVAKKFNDRVSAPVLTDVKVDFGELKVTDVFPRSVADVWGQRPLFIQGRYTQPGSGTVSLSGYVAGKFYRQTLNVILPEQQPENAVLAPLWARAKVDSIMSENYLARLDNEPGHEGGGGWAPPTDSRAESLHGFAGVAPQGDVSATVKDEVTNLGLQHHIMTSYTSYVAVDQANNRTAAVRGNDPDAISSRPPSLQGATNGTIGPQGEDATYVTGVNTAGTVRINNLANIEALLNILANLGEVCGILVGLILAIMAMTGGTFRKLTAARQIAIGVLLIAFGLALPGCINFLVASARDANLFS